ncbi:hypothetical protein KAJ27_08720 [bacterium]|nr:hypothetical protein [bacterium]
MGRRSQYFVKKKLQLKIFLLLIMIAVIILVMVGADVILIKNNFFLGTRIVNNPKLKTIAMFVMVIINVSIIIGFPLTFTHKIAGPIYRLEIEMDRIGNGDLSHNIKLRKGDFLTEIAVSLNGMQGSMKDRLGNIKKAILEIYDEHYSDMNESEKEKLEYLKALVDDLIIVPEDALVVNDENDVEEDVV